MRARAIAEIWNFPSVDDALSVFVQARLPMAATYEEMAHRQSVLLAVLREFHYGVGQREDRVRQLLNLRRRAVPPGEGPELDGLTGEGFGAGLGHDDSSVECACGARTVAATIEAPSAAALNAAADQAGMTWDQMIEIYREAHLAHLPRLAGAK
jgi:hypothetical protein